MNLLSAIRPAVTPELNGLQPSRFGADGVAKAIPFRELGTIGTLDPSTGLQPANKTSPAPGSFETSLGRMVSEVGGKGAAAGEAVAGLMSGQGVSLHQAMIAMEEASVSFQLMVEVRNKLLESYQELMRMQV
ncbi:MAG: flagellar hook-basal body complex protein FliE [Verrucomicrobiales bacterium]|nr:flagellar hook-basal body complex protein FliE [Verrucomicrobiales bacterium]